ncbi:hypothetical protein HMPREF2656_12305 [Corynebacterium sp. HMSC034B08]|uniref:DUF2020 domain-containing protein n=1 Tax=Corynebacterium sp. HMSC034B08 TaxID=1715135 RepID=UPI0008A8AEFA|nr:DUF2020 domain-containing protein [Corynebacterium sp. HMSC034B08]OHO30341.1 hypothetical protein HMPREF2656_12305 [Corynebacterium sp. HMSC034B08]
MRSRLPIVLLVLALAGCGEQSLNDDTPTPEPAPAPDSGLPVEALPETARDGWQECPYLDTEWVARTNGQRVTGVGTDPRFDTPACQFWSYPEEPQLTVIVRHMDSPEQAMAVVDWATPIDFTQPADQPEGWDGGRHGGGDVPNRIGAAYSVAKGNVAVTVFTNQDESVKAEAVATEAITNLGL